VSFDNKLFASCSADCSVRIWANDQLVYTLPVSGSAYGVSFSPDGKYLTGCSEDNTVRTWSTETGHLAQTLEGHASNVMAVCYSEDGKLIASASYDGNVKIWTAETNQTYK